METKMEAVVDGLLVTGRCALLKVEQSGAQRWM